MAVVRDQGSNRFFDGDRGSALLDVLEDGLVAIASECGGTGRCGLCRVRVIEGATNLGAVRPCEREHLGDALGEGDRLACQACIAGEGEIILRVPDPEK